MRSPLVLDFDRSVGALPGETRIDLADWQERIRFGSTLRTFRAFLEALAPQLPREHGTVFFGSGDYHHLSWPMIERLAARGPFEVVVFDNHPDNMRFPWGIHCGSWVRRVALLPHVTRVRVLGISTPAMMRTPEALAAFGPAAFGLEEPFVPVEARDLVAQRTA